jgi:cytochrome c oxidase assembly factor CtaG
MTQHVLLAIVAPPLLLLGRPWPRVLRPLPRDLRLPLARTVLAGPGLAPLRAAGRFVASPLPAFVAFNASLLVWHVPALYDLTLTNGAVHDLEHALFFGTGLLFWAHLVPGATARPRLGDGARVVYGAAGLLVGWLLAVVLGLAAHPLYRAYPSLADQQLAAGIMWVPASIPYCLVLYAAAQRWLDPGAARRRAVRPDLRPKEI